MLTHRGGEGEMEREGSEGEMERGEKASERGMEREEGEEKVEDASSLSCIHLTPPSPTPSPFTCSPTFSFFFLPLPHLQNILTPQNIPDLGAEGLRVRRGGI